VKDFLERSIRHWVEEYEKKGGDPKKTVSKKMKLFVYLLCISLGVLFYFPVYITVKIRGRKA
jgi:hypothetical protein